MEALCVAVPGLLAATSANDHILGLLLPPLPPLPMSLLLSVFGDVAGLDVAVLPAVWCTFEEGCVGTDRFCGELFSVSKSLKSIKKINNHMLINDSGSSF